MTQFKKKQVYGLGCIILSCPHYGLGYPEGYRPLGADINVAWNEKRLFVTVETHAGHMIGHEQEDFYEPHTSCDAGSVLRDSEEDSSWRVIIDEKELSWLECEKAIRLLLSHIEKDAGKIQFVWDQRNEEDELRSWKKEEERRIKWLKNGARPFKVALAPSFVEDMARLSGETAEEAEKDFQERGFARNAQGILERGPSLVDDGVAEVFEVALKEIALKLQDQGPLYLSSASWPHISFVAGTKKYRTDEGKDIGQRAWFGYLQESKKAALLYARNEYRIIEVLNDPDFLPAMRLL